MKRILLAACLSLTPIASALAQQDDQATTGLDITEAEQRAAIRFAVENMQFVLMHEAAHLLMGEFEIPPGDDLETVADRFAALQLLGSSDGGSTALIASADGWRWSAGTDTGGQIDGAYMDVHNPDQRRADAVVCLMVGSDPARFSAVAELYSLDPSRQGDCANSSAAAGAADDALFGPFARDAHPELTEAVATRYEPGGAYQLIADALEQSEVLETAARAVNARFAFARPITFVAGVCDQENAFIDAENGSVTLCYELADAFVRVYVENVLLGDQRLTPQ